MADPQHLTGIWIVLHWLAVHTGTVNEPGPYYGFWSGFGSDIGEIALIGAVLGIFRKHNCEVKGCWRLARHETAAGHKVCRKHHPDISNKAPTNQEVIDAHAAAIDQNPCGPC